MSRHKPFLCFVLIYFLKNATAIGVRYEEDECKNLCTDNFFLLPLVNKANIICQRGCRFFNIINAKNDLNINKSRNDCRSSCIEAYGIPDFEACNFGCSEMQKKRESELSKGFVLYIEQEGKNNVMVVQPDIDQVDLEILSDPGLRGQLDLGYSVEYKIPETRIRTMPITDGDNFGIPPDMTLKSYNSGDWLDCAARNSGIPRWILIAAILLAVLLGIWLIFASEKRETSPNNQDGESLIQSPQDDRYPIPPKYCLESEKV